MRTLIVAAAVLLTTATAADAQLLAARDNQIAYGHHHVYATDVEEHNRFWIDGLGGRPAELANGTPVIVFPNVIVFVTPRLPSAGTKGSVVNHVGFEVPNIRAAIARVQAAGFPMVSEEELPTLEVIDHVAQAGANQIGYVMGPDGMKVELMQISAVGPIRMHHVHWATPHGEEMQRWYAETLGVSPGVRIGQPAADVPGANLTFGPGPATNEGTAGRTLDHIGFEVKNLEEFCRELAAKGVEFDIEYRVIPELEAAIAFLTDPWGTRIELHEGLVNVR